MSTPDPHPPVLVVGAGPTGLAAVNLVWPVLMGVGTVGFMVGSGGSAVVSRTLGEGDFPRANRYFSLLIYVTAGAGVVLSGIFFFLIGPISAAMGAEGDLLRDCLSYGRGDAGGKALFRWHAESGRLLQCLTLRATGTGTA